MINEEAMKKIVPGAKVRVWEKISAEGGSAVRLSSPSKSSGGKGDKERLSRFEGLILARKHGSETGATFTVRTTLAGVGVERIYPIHSPIIDRVEIVAAPKRVRRAKLYYIRTLSRRETRKKLGASA